MPSSYIRVGIHFVWATWDRKPIIEPDWEERLHAAIAASCKKLKCPVYAINGAADHVHVLLRLSPTTSIAALAQHMKGTSSHFVNQELGPRERFHWQESYAALSVDKGTIDRVRTYILNQKQHHGDGTCVADWERTGET